MPAKRKAEKCNVCGKPTTSPSGRCAKCTKEYADKQFAGFVQIIMGNRAEREGGSRK